MIPTSLPVIVATALFTLLAVAALAWAWRRGFLDDLAAQSRIIFEDDDLQYDRPWETPAEKLERETDYGAVRQPPPGMWGGAA